MVPLLNAIVKDPTVANRLATAENKIQQAQSTLEIDMLAKANETGSALSSIKSLSSDHPSATLIEQELAAAVSFFSLLREFYH